MSQTKTLVFLVGLPGVGKTHIGKLIAQELNYKFIDLDREIEQREKNSISKIFQLKGESYFRQVEKKIFTELFSKTKTVLALGGGTPCFSDNLKLLKANGYLIWLDDSLEIITKRIESEPNKRPLFSKVPSVKKQLNLLLSKRKAYYIQSDYYFENSSQQISQIIVCIKNILGENEKSAGYWKRFYAVVLAELALLILIFYGITLYFS